MTQAARPKEENPVPKKLSVLFVEDSTFDVELILRELKKLGLDFDVDVVATPEEFRDKMLARPYDVVLSDYRLPGWTAMEALGMVRKQGIDLPFILVTGSLGEESAVDCIKEGVTDYVLKDRLARLPVVVQRALEEKALRDERRQTEVALRASEERYRLLFERNLAGVFRATLDGRFLDCNDAFARIFGYASRDEVLDRESLDFYFDPADREALLARLQEQKAIVNLEIRYRRKNGSPVWVLQNTGLVEDEKGVPSLLEGTLFDITERKHLEEQLLHSQKMEAVGQLAGGVAHDFNNLLTIITGYSQLLLARLDSRDPLREHVEEIKKAGERAASLTRQLLAFSRQQVLSPQVLDLNAVLGNMEKMLRRTIGEDIDLVIVRAPSLGRLTADPGQIEQVLLNLAINARDAMPHGGKLTLHTSNIDLDEAYTRSHLPMKPGPYVMLAVSDNGCGMDEEIKAHIFEPFFTTKEKEKGTGLGLAMVYGIVKQSGGYIWVYSEPSWGTAFNLYFPRVEQAVTVTECRPGNGDAPRGSETVLLVEDEGAVRSLARGILEANGYKVLDAGGGHEALLLCKRHEGPIHLMLTDVMMPQMNGRELATRVASLFPRMKLLYMSGYTNDTIVQRGVLESEMPFLQKPFTPDTLARKVREVLDGASVDSQRPLHHPRGDKAHESKNI